jgi:hypothetical protein
LLSLRRHATLALAFLRLRAIRDAPATFVSAFRLACRAAIAAAILADRFVDVAKVVADRSAVVTHDSSSLIDDPSVLA